MKADVFFHRLKPPLSFFSKSFIFVAIFTLVAQGCNKDGPTTQLPVLPRDGGGANCANMINHAELTDLTYKHIKYWQASFDNFIYVPQNVRATFQQKFDSLKNVVANMDVAQTINHFKNQGALTNAMAQQLSSLAQSIDALAQQGNPYSDYLTLLDTRSSQITNDAFMSCAEKEFLLNITAALKGYVLYAAESNPFAQFQGDAVQSRGCFWDWIGCFFRTLIKDILIGAFIGGVVGLITGTDVGVPNPEGGIIIVGPATAIGAAIGVIAGILHAAFTADDCCPDELDCRLPAGLSLSFATCAAAATYTPWGVGGDVAALEWTNADGMPTSAITTAPHSLFITQDVPTPPSIPVKTTFRSICSDGSINGPGPIPPFTSYLNNLVLEVSEFSIIGKKSVASGQPFIYSVQGVAANDGRHTFSFSVSHGTIIAQSGSQITVEWDDFGEGVLGEVIVTAQNICPSGKWKTKILYVDDDL